MVRHGLGEHAVDAARLSLLLEKAIGNDPPAASAMVDREHAATAVLGLADRGLRLTAASSTEDVASEGGNPGLALSRVWRP